MDSATILLNTENKIKKNHESAGWPNARTLSGCNERMLFNKNIKRTKSGKQMVGLEVRALVHIYVYIYIYSFSAKQVSFHTAWLLIPGTTILHKLDI